MARNVNEEEISLRKRARKRLIGAILLVIVSVVFLPMILDDEPQQEQQEIDIQIPSEESAAETYPWMTPENATTDDETEISSDPNKLLPFSDDDSAEKTGNSELGGSVFNGIPVPGRKPVLVKSTSNTQEKVAVTQEKASVSDAAKIAEGAFVIQLGAFSDVSKAKQQQQNLVFNGIRAYTEAIRVGDSEMTRVRIGPFPTREAAEAEHERLKKIGLSGVVTTK